MANSSDDFNSWGVLENVGPWLMPVNEGQSKQYPFYEVNLDWMERIGSF